jgi:uncharacterized protein YcbK (DUF882 family)
MGHPEHNPINRRMFLKLGIAGATAATLMPSSVFAKSVEERHRTIALYNLHTGESIKTTYWEDGVYHAEALQELNHLLRDYRNDQLHTIDMKLFDLLHKIQQRSGSKKAFHVISGYRSPQTNAMLHNTTNGVASKSLHMQGKAIDIRLPGFHLEDLRKVAMREKVGGVGFYPKSNFVHVDTGRVRYW